jgi:hypothetical protein
LFTTTLLRHLRFMVTQRLTPTKLRLSMTKLLDKPRDICSIQKIIPLSAQRSIDSAVICLC